MYHKIQRGYILQIVKAIIRTLCFIWKTRRCSSFHWYEFSYSVILTNLIQLYHDEDRKGHDYTFKMLIPSNYVTKLIGQST